MWGEGIAPPGPYDEYRALNKSGHKYTNHSLNAIPMSIWLQVLVIII